MSVRVGSLVSQSVKGFMSWGIVTGMKKSKKAECVTADVFWASGSCDKGYKITADGTLFLDRGIEVEVE